MAESSLLLVLQEEVYIFTKLFRVRFFLMVRCGVVRFNRTAPHRTILPLTKPHRTAPHRRILDKKNPHRAVP